MSNTVCIKTLNQGDAFNLDNSFLYIIYLFLIAHNSLQKCKKKIQGKQHASTDCASHPRSCSIGLESLASTALSAWLYITTWWTPQKLQP